MNGFKCNGCGHEMLDPTTVNGWPCPACKVGEMRHEYMVKGGRLEDFAWPGGYQIIWIADIDTHECSTICASCAMKGRDDGTIKTLDPQVYYEGPVEICEDCGKEMPAAYGDPDDPKDD